MSFNGTIDPRCGKRRYPSKKAARSAHSAAHWRVRTYFCATCKGWHVANHEKT